MKGIIDLFSSAKESGKYLLKQQNFSGSYQLTSNSSLKIGKKNPPVVVSIKMAVALEQVVDRKNITTKISVVDMSTDCAIDSFRDILQNAQLLTKIKIPLSIDRDRDGMPMGISNLSEMRKEWKKWKDRLPDITPDEEIQEQLILSYEDMLTELKEKFDNFDKNFQYQFFLPECYRFTNRRDLQEFGSRKLYKSRLIDKLDLSYHLKKENFSDENHVVKISLGTFSDIEKQEEQLIASYKQFLPDLSWKDYLFDVKVDYTFDSQTSDILHGKYYLIEQLHPDFVYTVEMELTKEENFI